MVVFSGVHCTIVWHFSSNEGDKHAYRHLVEINCGMQPLHSLKWWYDNIKKESAGETDYIRGCESRSLWP